jgi:hypothetical protein
MPEIDPRLWKSSTAGARERRVRTPPPVPKREAEMFVDIPATGTLSEPPLPTAAPSFTRTATANEQSAEVMADPGAGAV